jgi:hypothetical protein
VAADAEGSTGLARAFSSTGTADQSVDVVCGIAGCLFPTHDIRASSQGSDRQDHTHNLMRNTAGQQCDFESLRKGLVKTFEEMSSSALLEIWASA